MLQSFEQDLPLLLFQIILWHLAVQEDLMWFYTMDFFKELLL
jgi:hypothetical protein